MISNFPFYALTFSMSLILSLIFVPLIRFLSVKFEFYDKPNEIKTHKGHIPVFGGLGVFLAFSISLIVMRLSTSFPTGTLRDLRYILIGAFLMLMLGIVDDIKKPKGLSVEFKFIFQFIIAIFMVISGFQIRFISPEHLSCILSVLWIVGITNAFNIIDIMDGLSSSQIIAAGLAFWFISLPSEHVYVNLMAAAISGAAAGFFPYNMSSRLKIFMGDSGSLFCGFIMAVLSLGSEYSRNNALGFMLQFLYLQCHYTTLYLFL